MLDHETESYKENDDVRGVVIIQGGNESQMIVHDGIKITLTGIIGMHHTVT